MAIIHLAPYHYWHERAAQGDLFIVPAAPDPMEAECRTGS